MVSGKRVRRAAQVHHVEEEVREAVIALDAWRPVPIDSDMIERLGPSGTVRFLVWDSLIGAAAIGLRCRLLLSEALQDGQAVDGLTIVSPFTRRPEELL
jgi:predicted nucleic acid-binding protein